MVDEPHSLRLVLNILLSHIIGGVFGAPAFPEGGNAEGDPAQNEGWRDNPCRLEPTEVGHFGPRVFGICDPCGDQHEAEDDARGFRSHFSSPSFNQDATIRVLNRKREHKLFLLSLEFVLARTGRDENATLVVVADRDEVAAADDGILNLAGDLEHLVPAGR